MNTYYMRWGDGGMGRWGDGEMGRWGDLRQESVDRIIYIYCITGFYMSIIFLLLYLKKIFAFFIKIKSSSLLENTADSTRREVHPSWAISRTGIRSNC
ncbi:MAG: hypothetical protein F6K18_21310 [Okeania sp. SIO2C2]|uniref:hypothetical protein n=1 Tax=Okeania sp. SIO2C2 TaxID=2607787 RepID=UPI0013B8291F|nr:hypothetical protein [Okeania sp. SIO2C2]NEP89161.1 hypothetical protein [Okeania sp. SIO2C2]